MAMDAPGASKRARKASTEAPRLSNPSRGIRVCAVAANAASTTRKARALRVSGVPHIDIFSMVGASPLTRAEEFLTFSLDLFPNLKSGCHPVRGAEALQCSKNTRGI